MFERYLTDALTTHFGHFVENLDADKVRLSAWNGELVLQDLSLRPNALEDVLPDCPVELAYGKIGNLEIRIPWSLFRSQLRWKQPRHQPRGFLSTTSPCSIVLSDVNILITPRRRRSNENKNDAETAKNDTAENDEDHEKDIEQRRIEKEKQVQSLLDGHLLRRVTESSVSSSRWSWVQDWLSTLLSTLSVTVRNIHVRYEDPGTCMGFVWDGTSADPQPVDTTIPRSVQRYRPAFAVGVTLQQFSVESEEVSQSEDKEGEGKDESRSNHSARPVIYESRRKLAGAECLAIYWDSDCNLMVVNSDRLCNTDVDSSIRTTYSDYYHLAFQAANHHNTVRLPTEADETITTTKLLEHEALFKQRHSYVLDPISPYVDLTLVSQKDSSSTQGKTRTHKLETMYSKYDSDDSSNDGSTTSSEIGPQSEFLTPPSSLRIHLPPCKFTLARSTLEDTAYIRKSLSIWKHATKGILSEATLRRLARLRPTLTPHEDPHGWWFYAAQATLALLRVNKEGTDHEIFSSEQTFHRRRGWRGFMDAFRRRKRYVALYQSLVPRLEEHPSSNDNIDPATAHEELLQMEDELLPEEVMAFRLALYETWNTSRFMHQLKSPVPEEIAHTKTNTTGWKLWTGTQHKTKAQVMEFESDILSKDHRVAMLQEMTRALERERANVRRSAKEQVRQASMQQLPALDLNENDDSDGDQSTTDDIAVVWKASVACKEIAIQVNDESFDSIRSLNRATPVVRFSCGWVQDHWWYNDDSWDIDCSLASLLVKDLTQSNTKLSHGYFPNLMSRKILVGESAIEEDFVWIDGECHHKGLSIAIRRRLHWNRDPVDHLLRDLDRGSTTESRVRILPMEVVYSTVPVEVATRVLGTVKTPELVDDYHRMAAAAHGWQERQKKKFLAALAHKRKKIIVDVDVGAPELLIPEAISHPDSPMLAIDLGRLRVFNDEASRESMMDYDDQWRLVLSDIQVRSSTVAGFGQMQSESSLANQASTYPFPRQLVEPFSLEFAISTRILSDADQERSMETKIRIGATLPRLAFNLNSSSIRLVSRLKNQWEKRRNQKTSSTHVPATLLIDKGERNTRSVRTKTTKKQGKSEGSAQKQNYSSRFVKFDFTAPVISLRLDNDTGDIRRPVRNTDGARLCTDTPLLDLAFRGIRGSIVQERAKDGVSSTLFDARLHSLGALDLFQTAGKDFSLLLASAPPASLNGLVTDGESYTWVAGEVAKPEFWSGQDLVTIQYCSTTATTTDNESIADKLSIGFHELFVEWNPETFASIQESIKTPENEEDGLFFYGKTQEESFSCEEFFDAVEEASLGSYPDDQDAHLVSEVASSSFETAEADLNDCLPARRSSWSSSEKSLGIQNPFRNDAFHTLSPLGGLESSVTPLFPFCSSCPTHKNDETTDRQSSAPEPRASHEKGFELVFELSKLRVSFNKEGRHRKVMLAQMDGTSVTHKTRILGGSVTRMNIGNLIFTDPATSENATLYSQILGLKTRAEESNGAKVSSLLEMEILINPKTRTFDFELDSENDNPAMPVVIDREHGRMSGCNFFVMANFSPMRFVFLQQLWFEFIDYFFEGIIGNAVWGGRSSTPPAPVVEYSQDLLPSGHFIPGSDAKGFNFTRFDIQLEAPEVLLPVTYQSPQFLRLDLGAIHVSNRYDGTLFEEDDRNQDFGPRMQWFNNCSISMTKLRIFSWNGKEFGQDPIIATVVLRWPTGPTAATVTPKWRVKCSFDSLDIALRRSDYALVQHILSFNIGEPSRHLNEWNALQKLSSADFAAFAESILVHYGYDKKDVTPTTYDLQVRIPSVSAKFVDFSNDVAEPVAVARCIDLVWTLRKDSDLVVKQHATFDISLVAPSSSPNMEKLLSSWKYDQDTLMEDFDSDETGEIPELTYASTTHPSGDNTKTLEIVDACIYADIHAWRGFVDFFSTLPEPSLFDEKEIASSIQVGDRWYRIGGSGPRSPSRVTTKDSEKELKWMRSFDIYKKDGITTQKMLDPQRARHEPTNQIKVSLTSPRIILSSEPVDGIISHLVLRMRHLDLLHINSGVDCKVTRSFLFDRVEVYTLSGSTKRRKREGENSLIHPWSVGGMMEKCNGKRLGDCQEHAVRIIADILQARAAYSDMAVAIEVLLSVAHSAREKGQGRVSRSASFDSISDSSCSTGHDSATCVSVNTEMSEISFCSRPDFSLFDIECDGFELLVADDSGRHFATNQDLIILSLGKVVFSRRERRDEPSNLHLLLDGFDLFDCLQSQESPFRTAASTRSGTTHLAWDSTTSAGGDSEIESLVPRKFDWNKCKVKSMGDYKYKMSSDLAERLSSTTVHCSNVQKLSELDDMISSRKIQISCVTTETSQTYRGKLRSLSVQWNPSTVIAIQRFMGRLRKESKSKLVQVFHSEMGDLITAKSKNFSENDIKSPSQTSSTVSSTIEAEIELDQLKICLNKEHQNRRLLELTMTQCGLQIVSSDRGMSLDGRVGTLSVQDADKYSNGISLENRDVVKVITRSGKIPPEFLKLTYKTFKMPLDAVDFGELPVWVQDHISQIGGIDDFLSVRVAATEMRYLKERTEELIDYLSNGLPGKGMGVTSRAAKGFITKRILTKSFLEFQNDSPQVFVPQHETSLDGIALKLGKCGHIDYADPLKLLSRAILSQGDSSIRSYFEKDISSTSGPNDRWSRILGLELSGFQFGIRERDGFSAATNAIDLGINLRKPMSKGGEMALRGKLSFVDLLLKYSDYMLIRCVANDNVGKKVDTDKWDNIEKAYWSEEFDGEPSAALFSNANSASLRPLENRVAYSSNARFIRYGKAGKRQLKIEDTDSMEPKMDDSSRVKTAEHSGSSYDVKFILDGLSIKLFRDDAPDGMGEDLATAFFYDIILLRVQLVETSMTLSEKGDITFHLSLFRLGLFDLGDAGRLMRERYYAALSRASPKSKQDTHKGLRRACPFYVIAEGYVPDQEPRPTQEYESQGHDGPQLVVTVDKCQTITAGATGTISDLELPSDSQMTIARVVVNYLSVIVLIRPLKETLAFFGGTWPMKKHGKKPCIDGREPVSKRAKTKAINSKFVRSEGLQLKLVAHYPRVFFLADESDEHTRSLVLRGLAVINMSKATCAAEHDVQRVVSIDAQLNSMESYINADVHRALSFKPSHLAMVGEANARQFPEPDSDFETGFENALGVALIQPLTAGLEFCETNRDLFPTKRSVFVNVEPVSTMLSFEDLSLIETVLARLSLARSSRPVIEHEGDQPLAVGDKSEIPDAASVKKNMHGINEYEVCFRTVRLGLGLKTSLGQTVVNSIQSSDQENPIEVGDALVSIEGDDCTGLSLDSVVRRLSKTTRPITLKFCRREAAEHSLWQPRNQPSYGISLRKNIEERNTSQAKEAEIFSFSPYELNFKKGKPVGLILEPGLCGGYPVVMKVLPSLALAAADHRVDESNAEGIEATLEKAPVRTPRPGAIVVAVNDVSIGSAGVDEVWTEITKMTEYTHPELKRGESCTDEIYSISFMEIDSRLWGKVETIDISSSGFALSFIDDLHGRDMPLFRAKLDALEVHAERGLGGRTQIIEIEPTSLLGLKPNQFETKGSSIVLDAGEINDLKSETVVTLSGIALCSVDYFHPRIAFWEPFVEPAQLFMLLETQAGSNITKRPGQVALEMSDRLLRQQALRGNTAPLGTNPQVVTLNLTDSATQVAVKAINQWKEWRKTKVLPMDEDIEIGDLQCGENDIKLQESNRVPNEDFGVKMPTRGEAGHDDIRFLAPGLGKDESNMTSFSDTKRDAAQRAAQAALVFAQKRGADSSKKSDSAKPFLLRNRTGVSIAFVQADTYSSASSLNTAEANNLSVVGEYAGLTDFDPYSIHELADQEDARFSMDIKNESPRGESHSPSSKQAASSRVRNYEGRFPSLTVAIQAVSGVVIEPLVDLQVFKVGSTVRHLLVQKEDNSKSKKRNSTEYSIPVVWKVEIEDNRRVLTLSTAVRVVTTAFATQMEIGVQKMRYFDPVGKPLASEEGVQTVGIARPDSPFYLPLWLALKLEAVNIFVRPKTDGTARYNWGRSSVLRFAPLVSIDESSSSLDDTGTWVWEETFEELDYIRCDNSTEDNQPIWLAVFSGSSSNTTEQLLGTRKRNISTMNYEEEHQEVISVTLDSNVTLRNMLPMSVDWQIAHLSYENTSPLIVDGSTSRSATITFGDDHSLPSTESLSSGECTEVFACDYDSTALQARFREPEGQNWSAWAPLALHEDGIPVNQDNDEDDFSLPSFFPRTRQVNIQVTNDSFGVPLTFGVRIAPKMTLGTLDEPSNTRIYGIEIIVYAELWIKNITSLPLNFGCPSFQLHGDGTSPAEIFDETATRFNAESALMEIANLLEVGDKGTGLNKKAARELAVSAGIESLPNQECDELWEEVFEYLEIEFSTVKRRWWASESYDSFRMNITQSHENGHWDWIGENWSIDTAGNVNSSIGGWESSRNLLAGAGSFNGNRTFDSSHSIRRRRYYRNRTGHRATRNQIGRSGAITNSRRAPRSLHGGLQAFHQPLKDSFSREQRSMILKKKGPKNGSGPQKESDITYGTDGLLTVAVKCADGKWSVPTTIPDTGTAHGVLRTIASRWPALTTINWGSNLDLGKAGGAKPRAISDMMSPFNYRPANLSPMLYELCYTVSDVEGEWGEFSRMMVVSPRFLVRNDSTKFSIEVKQAGTADSSSLKLPPGAVEAFYWQDFRLPGLVCVAPCVTNDDGRSVYKWSGGFDICNLGMVPLRIRRDVSVDDCASNPSLNTVRALVEIRPGTGGFGINVSFREESPLGDGSLFRIENLSPFPIWLSQDGMLANPMRGLGQQSLSFSTANDSLGGDNTKSTFLEDFETNGDLICPTGKCAFGLDVPYRQGKYTHRRESTLKELLHVRVALAPLAHRAGIETVKVLGMTSVGESIRMNPSKLFGILDDELRMKMQAMRVLAVVCSDGPTRVLKVILVRTFGQDVIGNTFREVSYMATRQASSNEEAHLTTSQVKFTSDITNSAKRASTLYVEDKVPEEEVARKDALYEELEKIPESATQRSMTTDSSEMDRIYSIRAEFSGFLFSLVDSSPSEIAVATLRNFNVLARWNALRTKEASLILSAGWLQVDNHVPSAPFKVAVRPDSSRRAGTDDDEANINLRSDDALATRPLLMVAVAFAPKHNSGIVCLRSVTVAPQNLVIAIDLAFLVRLQRFFMGLKNHVQAGPTEDGSGGALLMYAEQKRNIPFPHFRDAEEELERAAAFGTENQKLYFQNLTILPASITLSVAPARALSPTQADLEGKEVAAIHQAVRKGDVLVGSSSALLGVKVGRKNTTPLAVVRGVFKSIVVDALLRLDGASLNFSGVSLQNHISTGPQLTTYLLTHYLASLRQNVPALLGSLAAFGNPLGLIRGLGDGMSDFVSQPVQGLKKSVRELDPTYLVDGVARGTGSLARHAVGGFADSTSLLTETFSKNMAVLTLDRRYAQKRDRGKQLRLNAGTTVTLAGGVESGFVKLVQGFMEGVTGVVKAPMRGAERKGVEGFAKGIGKGLLGLLVKPMIGISDAATDVMIGVRNSVEHARGSYQQNLSLDRNQFRPRRPMYGPDKVMRPYKLEDAAAAALMLRTRCAGENYLSHLDLRDRVALLSVKRLILLGPKGQELMALKYKHVAKAEVRKIPNEDNSFGWAIIIVLNTPRKNGSEVEVLSCKNREEAVLLCSHLHRGVDLIASEKTVY